jgi:hypothetical protein
MLKRAHVIAAIAVVVLTAAGLASTPVMRQGAGDRGIELSSRLTTSPAEMETPRIGLAAAAGYTITPHHYNALGSNGTVTQRFNARDLALFLFEADQGWSLSYVEACLGDVISLVLDSGRLTQKLFGGTARETNCGEGAVFGTAIMTIGNLVPDAQDPDYAWTYTTQLASPCSIANGDECRKMVCLRFDVFGIVTASCSTHLAPRRSDGSTVVSEKQANDYAFLSTVFAGGTFRIMSGDLNLLTNELPPTYYQNNRDGTYGDTFNVITGLTQKIDYIWIQNGGGGQLVLGRAANCSRRDASDHCYTAGTKSF